MINDLFNMFSRRITHASGPNIRAFFKTPPERKSETYPSGAFKPAFKPNPKLNFKSKLKPNFKSITEPNLTYMPPSSTNASTFFSARQHCEYLIKHLQSCYFKLQASDRRPELAKPSLGGYRHRKSSDFRFSLFIQSQLGVIGHTRG